MMSSSRETGSGKRSGSWGTLPKKAELQCCIRLPETKGFSDNGLRCTRKALRCVSRVRCCVFLYLILVGDAGVTEEILKAASSHSPVCSEHFWPLGFVMSEPRLSCNSLSISLWVLSLGISSISTVGYLPTW